MTHKATLASLIEADYPCLQAAYFDRFYAEWLSQGLDPEAAEMKAMVWSEKAAFEEAERLAEGKLSAVDD